MVDLFFFDEVSTFTRGLVLGVLVAAPVGPVGLLCVKRTLQGGILSGLCTGMGAAVADTFFGAIAAFGITAALDLMSGMEKQIRVFGGAFLVIMAIVTMMKHVHIVRSKTAPTPHKLASNFVSGLVITLTNPLTLIGVLAVVAAFSGPLLVVQAATLTGGIFCGSAAWWLLLCGGTHAVRKHLNDNVLTWVNRGTALLLLVLGGWALYTGIAALMGYPIWNFHFYK
jgi:threonine/homoserine/homoserine lactone efflux protein